MQVFEVVEDGFPIHCKAPDDELERRRLERERAWLLRCAHPGVVHPVPDRGDHVLRTRIAGPCNLAELGELEPAEVRGLGAALATTVADLHDLGIAHNRIRPDHVVVAEDGRPILCGFSGAGPLTDGGAGDVAALCATLSALSPSGSLRCGRGRSTLRRRSARSARALAAELARGSPPARLPARVSPRAAGGEPVTGIPATGPGAGRGRGVPARRSRAVVLGGVGAVAVGLATLSATVWAPVSAQGSAAATCPAPDRACGPLPMSAGTFVVDRVRWRVSDPDAVVVVGRFTCGAPLAAVLDRSDGAVWEFTTWPRLGRELRARPLAEIPGATSLQVLPGRRACDGLVAVGPTGRRVLVLRPGRRR